MGKCPSKLKAALLSKLILNGNGKLNMEDLIDVLKRVGLDDEANELINSIVSSGALTLLWTYKTNNIVDALAFSDSGNLGVASLDYHYYIFDLYGSLLNKGGGNAGINDASYYYGKFAFSDEKGNIYITREDGTLLKEIYVGDDYYSAITLLPDGFIACRDYCTYFDFNGDKKWNISVGWIDNGPAVYNDYIYAADRERSKLLILRLDDGTKVGEIDYDEGALDTAICGNQLAVVTYHYLYLYDLSNPTNPKELQRIGGLTDGWQAAFSPSCSYLAVANGRDNTLLIFDSNGKEILRKSYDEAVSAVAWWENRIAIGFGDGTIHVYQLTPNEDVAFNKIFEILLEYS